MFDRLGRGVALLRENERLTLILVSTALVMSGQGVMAPVLPLFASSFGVGAAAIGLTLSTFALARLILNVPLGVLSDRYGRRILLAGGPLVSAVGMLGSGVSGDLAELLGWRFVAGAGSAMYMTGAQVYLIDISTPATVEHCLAPLVEDPGAILEEARSDVSKAKLREQTGEAGRIGIFGAPSFVAGSELFWGNDRLEDALLWTLEKG